MVLRGSDRRLVFERAVDRRHVFMFVLRYRDRSLLPQNVGQGSESESHESE